MKWKNCTLWQLPVRFEWFPIIKLLYKYLDFTIFKSDKTGATFSTFSWIEFWRFFLSVSLKISMEIKVHRNSECQGRLFSLLLLTRLTRHIFIWGLLVDKEKNHFNFIHQSKCQLQFHLCNRRPVKGWVGEVVDRLGGLRLIWLRLNVLNEEESSNCYEHRTTKRSELVAEIQTTDANEFILSRLANGSNQKICPSSLV